MMTWQGWYDYSAGRTPVVDPEVEQMLIDTSTALGFTRRPFDSAEVLDRCLLPLVNEGFRILDEGIAQREGDIDIIWIYGYGFPRYRGGPMHWARHIRPGGLAQVAEDLRKYAAAHPNVSCWEPSALLLREAGLDVTVVNKVLEGRPHCVDALKSGDIQLVVNTTEGAQAIADSFDIRRTALTGGVAHYTTIAGARAAVAGIAAMKAGALDVAPLQSYFNKPF